MELLLLGRSLADSLLGGNLAGTLLGRSLTDNLLGGNLAGTLLGRSLADSLLGDTFPCPHELRLEGRSFDCSHPPPPAPLTVRTAIAYSCNCFVAHYASRFRAGELAFEMERWGLVSRTNWFGEGEAAGRVWNAPSQLQSLGEDGVVVTPASLALAYCRLASRGALAGMADAVEFGTAQRARVTGLKVAGKTGSVRTPTGVHLAWFAGFTDGAVVTVMLQAKSGGADAAPIAGRILEAHWKGQL